MIRTRIIAGLIVCLTSTTLEAQSIAQRVRAADGVVQVVYPSRASACGDGSQFIGGLFSQSARYSTTSTSFGRDSWSSRSCVHGPAHLALTVIDGEVTRIRAYVGPVQSFSGTTIDASATDASAWLLDIISRAPARVASDAIFALVLADAPEPWIQLLRVARDGSRPLQVRQTAITWLATGVTEHLGLTDERADSDDDEMGKQAVFVLSQRPKNESVPELIDLARSSKRQPVRRMAIFWLGQTGDARAVDVYADLLR